MNQKEVTITRLRTLNIKDQTTLIHNLIEHNCATLWRQLRWLAQLPEAMRMFRITSHMVPGAGVADFADILQSGETRFLLFRGLDGIRRFADAKNIRLCMHPGQYSNLCSTDSGVVTRAIADIEHHADLAVLMGYGDTWHSSGFVINIHANIRQDPGLGQLKNIVNKNLSPAARNLLTLENDEFGCGLEDMIHSHIYDTLPIILDLHHHWIRSAGEYISPGDPRVEIVAASWQNVRPLSHLSTSAEDLLVLHPSNVIPNFSNLVTVESHRPAKLRAHSVMCWNEEVNRWAALHLQWTDIEVEAKGKNLASEQLYKSVVKKSDMECQPIKVCCSTKKNDA